MLGIEVHDNLTYEQALVCHFERRALLLVLDNCEHLVEACASLVVRLLASCPNLHILVTSREGLGVEGEVQYPLCSLNFPDPQHLPELKAIKNFESVELFLDCVERIFPGFALTQQNAPVIARVCQCLEGIPLALELAAARASLLSVEEIAARLESNCLSGLAPAGRGADPRHHTMRTVLNWSYQLLSEPEQVLLRRLAVFSGGWTLAAAEAVCAEPGILPSADFLDVLHSLVNKSMVVAEQPAGQERRCRLLEPICQYLDEKLAQAGEKEAVQDRHLDYYLLLARQAEPHLRSHQAVDWLRRLEREMDNIRAALRWSMAENGQLPLRTGSSTSRPIEKGLQLAAALLWYWAFLTHHLEGIEWIQRLIDEQKNRPCPPEYDRPAKVARGRALNSLAILIGDTMGAVATLPRALVQQAPSFFQESRAIFQELGEAYQRDWAIAHCKLAETMAELLECRELFRTLNEPFWMAECDNELTFWARPDQQMERFYQEEHLAIRKELGDLRGLGWAYKIAAAKQYGNHERFCELMQHALDCLEKLGNRWRAARERSLLVKKLIDYGDYEGADRQIELMQAPLRELDDPTLLLHYLRYRGYLAWAKGEYQQAVDCGSEGMALTQRMSLTGVSKFFPPYILGRVALSQGDANQAREYFRNIITLELFAQVTPDWKNIVIFTCIHALVLLAAIENKHELAARFIGAQDRFFEQSRLLVQGLTPRGRAEFEQAQTTVRAALDSDDYAAAVQAGSELSLEQVVQLAQELFETPIHP